MRPDGARPLSREDLSILALENETVAGHTCKVILLSGAVDPGRLRSSIAERLAGAPLLRLRLGEVGGQPWWLPDPHLDVTAHVVHADRNAVAGEAGFRAAVAGIFAQHLDRSRPLWRIDVIPRPADGGSALVWRIHHALADGMTAMRVAGAVLWDEDPAGPPGPAARHPGAPGTAGRPGTAAAPGTGRHRAGTLLAVAREAPRPWLRSPFDGHIDGRRSVAFTTAPLDPLRRVARAAGGATVNDAVLTVVAGGIRRWLEARHGHLGEVRVKVPVSLHPMPGGPGPGPGSGGPGPGGPGPGGPGPGGPGPGNRDSFFCLDLPLSPAEPLARLAAVRRATRVRKADHDAQHLDELMRELTRVPRLGRFAQRILAHPRSFALNVSNVPGPRRPVRVLGVPVAAMYSLAEIGEHHALRVAVVSLAGELNFGLVADPTLLADVDHLAADVHAEAAALAACAPPAG